MTLYWCTVTLLPQIELNEQVKRGELKPLEGSVHGDGKGLTAGNKSLQASHVSYTRRGTRMKPEGVWVGREENFVLGTEKAVGYLRFVASSDASTGATYGYQSMCSGQIIRAQDFAEPLVIALLLRVENSAAAAKAKEGIILSSSPSYHVVLVESDVLTYSERRAAAT
eukprot:1093060-Pleurochrysis_carterae.AAC.1